MSEVVRVADFSGGLTDFILGGAPSQYVLADNLLLNRNRKIYSRPGSILYDTTNGRPTGITDRISSIWDFDGGTALLVQNARKVWRYNSGWTEITGAGSNAFFDTGTTAARVTGSMWRGHLLLTNDVGTRPVKLFRTASTTYKAVTAGLPKYVSETLRADALVLQDMADLATELRADMLTHFASAAAHTTGADTVSDDGITAGALLLNDTLATAITLTNQLMAAYKNHYQDAIKLPLDPISPPVYHPINLGDYAGVPNVPLKYTAAPTTFLEVARILDDLKEKWNWHVRSFRGHGAVVGEIAAAFCNAHGTATSRTVEGPNIWNSGFLANTDGISRRSSSVLSPIVNSVFNNIVSHMGDTARAHTVATAFGNATDTRTSALSIGPFTETRDIFEAAAHAYGMHRIHNDDARLPVYRFSGRARNGGNSTIFDQLAIATAGTPIPDGQPRDTANGMYINYGALAPTDNVFPAGTSISSGGATTTLTMSAANSATMASVTQDAYLSKKTYHSYLSDAESSPSSMVLAAVDWFESAHNLDALIALIQDIRTKFNAHDNSQNYHGTTLSTGNWQVSTANSYTQKHYQYAFVYKYKYTLTSGEQFTDVSTPRYLHLYTTDAIENFGILFDRVVAASNASTLNYDTASVTVDVYRTIDNGTNFYLAQSITSPGLTTAYQDQLTDEDLITKEQLYTNGGVVENDPPPRAKYLHITEDGYAYYGNVTLYKADGTDEVITNRIMQAVADDPDSCPEEFFVDLPLAVAGVSSVKNIPIGWTATGTYRIEGKFDELGQGYMKAVAISDRIGLTGAVSPVQVDGGVVFAGPDQFYLTDGYQVLPLGKAWPTTYATLVSTAARANNILGAFDKLSNRVWYAVTDSGTENTKCYILDLNYPINPETGGVWTTASNGTSFAPTSLAFYGGQLIRGDSRGYIFKHDAAYTSDPRVDGSSTFGNTNFKTITFDYKSIAHNFGVSAVRKYGAYMECKLENLSNTSVQIKTLDDVGRLTSSLSVIRAWSVTGEIDEKRYFAAGSMRFTDRQIEFTNGKVAITNSDSLGLATVDTVANTLTILAGTFPADMLDHVVSLANDSYVTEYTVSAQNAGNTILTLTDAGNLLPANGNYAWVIRGYPKTEKFQLNEYSLVAAIYGRTQSSVRGESGENA